MKINLEHLRSGMPSENKIVKMALVFLFSVWHTWGRGHVYIRQLLSFAMFSRNSHVLVVSSPAECCYGYCCSNETNEEFFNVILHSVCFHAYDMNLPVNAEEIKTDNFFIFILTTTLKIDNSSVLYSMITTRS